MVEAVITIDGKKHRLWRVVNQFGIALDVLVQSRRDRYAGPEGDAKTAQNVRRHPLCCGHR